MALGLRVLGGGGVGLGGPTWRWLGSRCKEGHLKASINEVSAACFCSFGAGNPYWTNDDGSERLCFGCVPLLPRIGSHLIISCYSYSLMAPL